VLHIESNKYYVYPSWAQLSYKWEDLGRHLADPLNSPYIRDDPNRRRFDWKERGWPVPVQPFDMIDGPEGGGIIKAHIKREERWLPEVVLGTEANICCPPGMQYFLLSQAFNPCVFYLEPFDSPGWQFLSGKKTKLYLCSASLEHVEGDPKKIYWVVGYKKAKREIKTLGEIGTWAHHFKLEIRRLPHVPEDLRQEVAPWFISPVYEYVWFDVSGGGEGIGFHFAVVVYVAFHLRKVAGPRIDCMHLVSDIEGKPNVRSRFWPRR
jgi:hypothetical protein